MITQFIEKVSYSLFLLIAFFFAMQETIFAVYFSIVDIIQLFFSLFPGYTSLGYKNAVKAWYDIKQEASKAFTGLPLWSLSMQTAQFFETVLSIHFSLQCELCSIREVYKELIKGFCEQTHECIPWHMRRILDFRTHSNNLIKKGL